MKYSLLVVLGLFLVANVQSQMIAMLTVNRTDNTPLSVSFTTPTIHFKDAVIEFQVTRQLSSPMPAYCHVYIGLTSEGFQEAPFINGSVQAGAAIPLSFSGDIEPCGHPFLENDQTVAATLTVRTNCSNLLSDVIRLYAVAHNTYIPKQITYSNATDVADFYLTVFQVNTTVLSTTILIISGNVPVADYIGQITAATGTGSQCIDTYNPALPGRPIQIVVPTAANVVELHLGTEKKYYVKLNEKKDFRGTAVFQLSTISIAVSKPPDSTIAIAIAIPITLIVIIIVVIFLYRRRTAGYASVRT